MISREREGGLYWMYCARTVAGKGKKDAFSIVGNDEM